MVDKYPDRRAAYDILSIVYEQRRPLDEAIEMADTFKTLDSLRDRAFALLIVRTVLKREGEVKACLSALLTRVPKGKQGRAILRVIAIGVVQIVHLGVKPHAAVDGCVRLVAAIGAGGMKGLVNAVLRRLVDHSEEILGKINVREVNTPKWLFASWVAAYGHETALKIAEANLLEPPLDITLRNGLDGWDEKLDAISLPIGSLRRRFGGIIPDMPGFQTGDWWVQDAAASIPVRLLADVTGKNIVDLCAAPGGKTAQLSAGGANVIAVDRSQNRLKALVQNMTRLKLNASVVQADATQWQPPELADAVLLDAPCSATGTIRRHPDIMRLKMPEDIETLSRVQAAILDNAATMVKPGGVLIFCTCSMEAVEGPAVVDDFMQRTTEYERVPIQSEELGGLTEIINENGDLRSLPFHLKDVGGMDGFYAARLRRRDGSA